MSVIYDFDKKIFNIQTPNTSYVMGVLYDKYLIHLYYGKKVDNFAAFENNFPVVGNRAFSALDIAECDWSTDVMPMEYPCYGSADLRTPAFHAEYEMGSNVF